MSENFYRYIKKDPAPIIRFRCAFRNTVYDAMKARGWKETDSESDWDFYWCDKEWIHDEFDHIHLLPHQKVNHFRNHYELTRKDLLIKNLKRSRRALEREGKTEEAQAFAIYPVTFVLPLEYSMFVEEFKKSHNSTWIMKPVGKSQGRGIFLFDKLSQISDWKNDSRWKQDKDQSSQQPPEAYVVQKYIESPLLVGGKKFDLRLYALVTSYSPLTIYVYRDGFARFSHTHFTMDDAQITNMCMHLTNVAVQKNSDKYDESSGGKWPLRNLKLHLISRYGHDKVNKLMIGIHNTILKSLIAVQKVMINDKHCFELYGYDVIIDTEMRPWLLEVNASPSLSANTRTDYEMKIGLLDDVLSVVDMEKFLTGTETQIGGFDLIYKSGPCGGPPATATYGTYLGQWTHANWRLTALLLRRS
eukprot:GHVQ01025153.1.p1 GENE.GHVQ01025153.1~~GHVQ01025153.1.p1  ORF type:complete len:416 (-),score=30.71 GHVQ01025153.1:429-1676(-)